eukprot:TRINITY_DN32410_c0_g1_i1.p1 TRINITY_DN32410_c0_g1~~TRINITY_DN32410_c0_g1_i1.p1  ORF type:complete len:579 (-),score=61.55 TRINITY_DN32410_c0_g1_i1:52-1716(-)
MVLAPKGSGNTRQLRTESSGSTSSSASTLRKQDSDSVFDIIQNSPLPGEYLTWYERRLQTTPVDDGISIPTPDEYRHFLTSAAAYPRYAKGFVEKLKDAGFLADSVLKCRYCKKLSSSIPERDLQRHEQVCGNRTCEDCCKTFESALQLQGHKHVCGQRLQNRCEFCAKRFRNQGERDSHMLTCELNPELWCDWCGSKFSHITLRRNHQRQCPRHPQKFCSHCSCRFGSRAAAMAHAVFCSSNPLSLSEPASCSACFMNKQCIRFPCGSHFYCSTCLFQQVRVGLSDRSMLPLRCCRKEVQAGDAVDLTVRQMLTGSSLEKYEETMLLRSSKRVMYCPYAECRKLLVLDGLQVEGGNENRSSACDCPHCGKRVCLECKSEWHEGLNCVQYRWAKGKAEDDFTKLCRARKWMICWECCHVVEKSSGCNHITCHCGAQFCYLCGAKWGTCKCEAVGEGHALRHNRVPAAGQQHQCQWCRQVYPSELELEVHRGICAARPGAVRGRFHHCRHCREEFRTENELIDHRRTCAVRLRREQERQAAYRAAVEARILRYQV